MAIKTKGIQLMIYIILAIIGALVAIAAIVVAVVLGVKFLPPISRGERGERIVASALGETVPGEQYVVNDLLFKTGNGQSCQIDHVYINRHGIWVIETKNLSGKIFGNANANEWTQVLAYGRIMHKFRNPIKQNQTHIYRLSQFLGVRGIFHSVVVFPQADITAVESDVYDIQQLHDIKTQPTKTTLTVGQMEFYYTALMRLKNNSTISKQEHIANIREAQRKIDNGICPRCGGKLVLRQGEYGMFYGCSNYPRCKFTKKIE